MKKLSTLALMLAIGLSAPAFAQDANSSATTNAGASASVDPGAGASASTETGAGAGSTTDNGGASTSVDATTSTSVDATASSAPDNAAGSTTQVNVTTEQKTEIHNAVTELNVQPAVNINFDVNVGVAVPQTVVLTPLPPRLIKIFPSYSGFLFFVLADGRVVIVDPHSLKIVIIIA
jgi:hypothetical protein